MKELLRYLYGLNDKHGYDLEAEWTGNDDTPLIRVYEEADGHDLAHGYPEDIVENVREALPHWGWETE